MSARSWIVVRLIYGPHCGDRRTSRPVPSPSIESDATLFERLHRAHLELAAALAAARETDLLLMKLGVKFSTGFGAP